METNNHIVLIVLSGIVLISHFFNVISKFLRIPSVILLIGFGIILKNLSTSFNVQIFDISEYVHFLGAIGLILIVLEGVLDLKVRRKGFPIIRKSFGAALIILLISTGVIGALFYFWLGADLMSCFANAIPLAVISSAVVIPSIHHLSVAKKNFLTYEAIFSDILGIMLFNFMITQKDLSLSSFAMQTVVAVGISLVVSMVLVLFIFRMKTKTKFFIIISLLFLMYGIGELFHLSSLLLVFTFGLLLGNYRYLSKIYKVKGASMLDTGIELTQFKQIVDESAFLIRTFFFIAFGYSIDVLRILNIDVIMIGVPIVLILLAVRFVYLNYMVRTHVFPELFIAPKGLITILLFYSIPQGMLIDSISEGVLLFVILATSLLMIIGGDEKKYGEQVTLKA